MSKYKEVLKANILAVGVGNVLSGCDEDTAHELFLIAHASEVITEHLMQFDNFEDLKAEIKAILEGAKKDARLLDETETDDEESIQEYLNEVNSI